MQDIRAILHSHTHKHISRMRNLPHSLAGSFVVRFLCPFDLNAFVASDRIKLKWHRMHRNVGCTLRALIVPTIYDAIHNIQYKYMYIIFSQRTIFYDDVDDDDDGP